MSGQPSFQEVPVPRLKRGWRLFIFYSSAVLLTGLVSMLFADLLWRTGWSASSVVLLVLFVVLFLFIAIGAMHGIYGFFLRIFGTRRRITALGNYRDRNIDGISTAIVFPIYNENAMRVYEGLRATYESLEKTGQLDRFDFFILSDSTDADKWVEEERRWYDLIRDLDALGKIYYRRRVNNEGRKSGNVRDFLNAWGTPLPLFHGVRRRQRDARRNAGGPGEIDGGASGGRTDSDRSGAGQCGVACSAASSNLPTAFTRRCSSPG